jgi:DNA-binding Lrp family transcriptional regulator
VSGELYVLVGPGSRELRRRLRAVEWVVLEEVALDAVVEHGRATAATSARRIADNLGIDPGTASSALRRLRSLGLVEHDRADGTAGRFGLSVYILVPTPGIELVPAATPRRADPRTAEPRTETPRTETPRMETPRTENAQERTGRTPRTPRTPKPTLTQLDLLDAEAPTSRGLSER